MATLPQKICNGYNDSGRIHLADDQVRQTILSG
jgi:hypothetical protein